jgi:hypothetical protein
VGFSPPPPPETRREPRAGRGLLAVRVLRPPVEIEVLTAGAGEGDSEAPPVEIRATPRAEEEKRPRVEGTVKVASGPWGLEEEWWADDPAGRDYWDVEIAGRGLYRIYRERATGAWYADGIYD